MKRSRFSKAQIIGILKEHEAGMSAPDLCRKHGISDATFANALTQVGMPQANLTAQLPGLGRATADSCNLLSVSTPAVP